jgi:cell shape-determining protein MreD
MNWLTTLFLLVAIVLAVFWEAAFQGIRNVLGAQVDLLPSLMVYAALCGSISSVCLAAGFGGLLFDSLSANPLGISILPLFAVGFVIHLWRELILRDQAFAQTILGFAASVAVPIIELLLLLTIGRSPQLGWGTLWQLVVMALGGAVATPICFLVFELLQKALLHAPVLETSFRPDREIRRGR